MKCITNALNSSKGPVKTCIMLYKISIGDKMLFLKDNDKKMTEEKNHKINVSLFLMMMIINS